MIVKHAADHVVEVSDFCGQLREVLLPGEHDALDLTVAEDITHTVGHFHRGFDEIYFLMSGTLTLELYDPDDDRCWREVLERDELCVIPNGMHHRVVGGSEGNRLCCICIPGFDSTDQHRSDQLEAATR